MASSLLDKRETRIRAMFGDIARSYDLLNHLLSLNIDRYWRWRTTRLAPPAGDGPILDVCTGTGDLALAYDRAASGRVPIVGSDFCLPMLLPARDKARRRRVCDRVRFLEADTQRLPFADDLFQLVTVAFGLRNVTDTDRGLAEMVRVARPGGRVAILEFSRPRHWLFGPLYRFYFRRVLPIIGQAGVAQPRQRLQLSAGQRDGVPRRRSAGGEAARPRADGREVASADVWDRDAVRRDEAAQRTSRMKTASPSAASTCLCESERFAEHHRLEPSVLFARGGVALRRATEDVERQRFLAGVHQPVFADAGFPIGLLAAPRNPCGRTGADDLQHHVRRAFQGDDPALSCRRRGGVAWPGERRSRRTWRPGLPATSAAVFLRNRPSRVKRPSRPASTRPPRTMKNWDFRRTCVLTSSLLMSIHTSPLRYQTRSFSGKSSDSAPAAKGIQVHHPRRHAHLSGLANRRETPGAAAADAARFRSCSWMTVAMNPPPDDR